MLPHLKHGDVHSGLGQMQCFADSMLSVVMMMSERSDKITNHAIIRTEFMRRRGSGGLPLSEPVDRPIMIAFIMDGGVEPRTFTSHDLRKVWGFNW